jgi:hypothetical protein
LACRIDASEVRQFEQLWRCPRLRSLEGTGTDERLGHAVELRIVWPRDPNVSNVSVNNWPEVLDLRHFSLGNVWTWKNVIVANDTYGAIKTVLDCVSQHTPFR